MAYDNPKVKTNALGILTELARDQHHMFEDKYIRALLGVGAGKEVHALRNIIGILLNLSRLDEIIENMARAGVLLWLATVLETKDKKTLEIMNQLIKNIFVNSASLDP